jgi:hypothetical protein
VQISAGTPDVLTEVSHGVPHYSQTNAKIVSRLGHNSFLINSFKFIIHLPYHHPTVCSLDTENGFKYPREERREKEKCCYIVVIPVCIL